MTDSAATVFDPEPAAHMPQKRVYRPEVDGLRAVAVLPVIMFHAGFPLFSGGYVGVDVFFVISGYLITSIILQERLEGRFSLVAFYERRARRILPALFLMMAVCIPLAFWLMSPAELENFGLSLVSVSVFVSNVLFWLTSGYFGGAAELKPLLHTWSLGIEEQYYILFPLLLAVTLRWGLRVSLIVVTMLATASLALSHWLTTSMPMVNFFLLPPRAWELLVGSILAMAGAAGVDFLAARRSWREVGGIAGLALILLPVAIYDETTPFPGLAALPPVIGTALILAMTTPETMAGRLLTLRPMLWVGLISYSAYLWHQPLFAFARMLSANHLATAIYLGLAALALVFAWLSWRFVEAPFRERRNFSRRKIFTLSVVGSLFFVAIGGSLAFTKGMPDRFDTRELPLVAPQASPIEGCPESDNGTFTCPLGIRGKTPTFVLLGDSHAYALAPSLDIALARKGVSGVLIHTACHPIPGIFDSREPNDQSSINACAAANKAMIERATAPQVDAIIVAIRWTLRLYPMGEEIDYPWFDNGEGGIEDDTPYRKNLAFSSGGVLEDDRESKAGVVRNYLQSLGARKTTVVVYPVPEVGWTPNRFNLIAHAFGRPAPAAISTSMTRYLERNRAAIELLDSVQTPPLRRVKPAALLCDTAISDRCVVQASDVLYYYDDDHLTVAGADPIVHEALRLAEAGSDRLRD